MAAAEVLGTLTSQKIPFSHSDMSTIYSKSQWKLKIAIELTFMDNIKTWKNTAKRMIDFLPVTWKCCFYSAHFQPGGMFYPKRMWRNSMVLLQIFWRKTTSARPPSFRGFQQHQLPSHDLRLDLSGREELPHFSQLCWKTSQHDIVWLVVDLPLWKIWVRQLGYVGIIVPNIWKNKIHVQTTNPMT